MTATNLPETLLLIGASTRAAAWSASRPGLKVVSLDLFADRDTAEYSVAHRIVSYPDSIVAQATDLVASAKPGSEHEWPAKPHRLDLVLTGGMENHPSIVAELERRFRLHGPNAKQIVALRNLDNLKRWCRTGVRFPEIIQHASLFTAHHSSVSPSPLLGERGPGGEGSPAWLVKPYRSSAGLGVRPWAPDFPVNFSDCYLQRRIEGDSVGVVFSSTDRGLECVGATRNLTQPQTQPLLESAPVSELVCACGLHDSILRSITSKAYGASDSEQPNRTNDLLDFIYSGSQGPVCFSDSQCRVLKDWLQPIVEEIDYRGLLQADFIVTRSGDFYLLEFNPRWTAGIELIELMTGRHLMREHLKASSSQNMPHQFKAVRPFEAELRKQPDSPPTLFKLILYASHPIPITPDLSDQMMSRRFQAETAGDLPAVGWSDIPTPGTTIAPATPLATILIRHESNA